MADEQTENKEGLGSTVASHYNQLKEVGIEARKDSRIFHMRGFNNWFKSVLINEFSGKIKERRGRNVDINVLDLGSGKGGDQKKWKIAGAKKVIHADIAATSVEQSKERYRQIKEKENPRYPTFDAEFHAVDCSKERIKDRLADPEALLDITSCQFVFHYSFETLEQADMMMRNACELLRPGGYFFGTTPDARELISRLKKSDSNSFGNEIYRVTFDSKTDFPLFGCKYNFHLDGVVDCPEFLVHFPMLEKLAEKYGMIPVYKENFANLYEQKVKDHRHSSLLRKMGALEEYPAAEGKELSFSNPDSYKHAEKKLEDMKSAHPNTRCKLLTIAKEEWEAITVYLAFAFQKLGTPVPDEEDFSLTNQKTEDTQASNQETEDSPKQSNQDEAQNALKRKHSDSDGNDDEDESESKAVRRSVSPPTLVT